MSTFPAPVPADHTPALSLLKRRWSIYTPGELKQRRNQLSLDKHLIEGLLPHQSLGIFVGDSGIGKSPFLYQAALCVAAGIPFLNHPVTQGRVLYLDFENGLGDVDDMTDRLARYLGLSQKPQDLLLWNFNDASPKWQPSDLCEMIRDVRPVWTIVDSLGAFSPDIEEKSSNVTRTYQGFRKVIREQETSVMGVHHPRKPSSKPDEAPASLQDDPHRWFLQARGARQLVNGADVRLGVDESAIQKAYSELDGKATETAFVLGGFGRVRGKLAPMYVGRVFGEDGQPIGYRTLAGVSLLFNTDQQDAYRKLPAIFTFKEAQLIYGRGAQASTDFLKKCCNVGILSHAGRQYRKMEVPE